MPSWNALGRRGQWILAVACVLAILLVSSAGWWLLRPDRAVLFSDVRAQDTAMIAAELDKLKVPYALSEAGDAILVERSQVHAVRMKLMGRDLPLHGTVGFELFNHTDFGMTEFVQKVNYQRALQGELTRTILAFPEVREARVHLVLPEQALFRQNATRPKAAVTLGLRQGRALRAEQVSGIQRLVAAAVPGLVAAEVTLIDQKGQALTRSAEASEGSGADARLDLKREMETYLARKVDAVLERAFGAGQALSSVDVTLNLDQVRVTTEDVIAAPGGPASTATGVLVRERESARDTTTVGGAGADARAPRGSSVQRDVEYQTGRRVEHVVSQPGAVRRLQVVAVVRQGLDEGQREQLQRLVAAAAGALPERGDTVVVQALSAAMPMHATVPPDAASPTSLPEPAMPPPVAAPWWPWAAFAALLLLAWPWLARRRQRGPSAFSEPQRQIALERVQAWLVEPAAGAPAQESSR